MSLQHISEFSCFHGNPEEFDVLDWLGSKIKLCLCKKCQTIPEFSDILNHNKIKENKS